MSLARFMPRWGWIAFLLLGSILLVAAVACGGGGGGGTPAAKTPAAATPTAGGLQPQPKRPATAQEVQKQVFTPTDGVIEFGTRDNFFGKNHFQVSTGQTVTFKVRNTGQNPHTFTIAGADGKFGTSDDITTDNITAGEAESLDVTLTVPGTYVFRCEVHPTEMWGNIDSQ